ncbi:1927_t:CDS:2, partial [Dentiscutata heterogama]
SSNTHKEGNSDSNRSDKGNIYYKNDRYDKGNRYVEGDGYNKEFCYSSIKSTLNLESYLEKYNIQETLLEIKTKYMQSKSDELELLLSNNESESPYLNNETKTLSSNIESDLELEKILKNDNKSETELLYLNDELELLSSNIE